MWFAVNKLTVDNKHHVESLRWDKKNAHGVFLLCMLLVIYKRDRFTGTVSFPRAIKFSLKSWFFIRLLILICVWYHITICFYWTAPKHNPWDEIYRPIPVWARQSCAYSSSDIRIHTSLPSIMKTALFKPSTELRTTGNQCWNSSPSWTLCIGAPIATSEISLLNIFGVPCPGPHQQAAEPFRQPATVAQSHTWWLVMNIPGAFHVYSRYYIE